MKFEKAIKEILKEKKITQTALAKKLGSERQSNVSVPLHKGNITINKLLEWLDVLDYELTIQPKMGAGKRREGQHVISLERDE